MIVSILIHRSDRLNSHIKNSSLVNQKKKLLIAEILVKFMFYNNKNNKKFYSTRFHNNEKFIFNMFVSKVENLAKNMYCI